MNQKEPLECLKPDVSIKFNSLNSISSKTVDLFFTHSNKRHKLESSVSVGIDVLIDVLID